MGRQPVFYAVNEENKEIFIMGARVTIGTQSGFKITASSEVLMKVLEEWASKLNEETVQKMNLSFFS